MGADPEPPRHTLRVLPVLLLVLPVMAARSPVARLASAVCLSIVPAPVSEDFITGF